MAIIQLLTAAPFPESVVQQIVPTYRDGCWIKSYDPEADLEGLVCTMDESEALDIPMSEAMALWQSSPSAQPLRDDGLPNKPLTAFTIAIDRTG